MSKSVQRSLLILAISAGVCLSSCRANDPSPDNDHRGEQMPPKLHLALQDGFEGDLVVVTVNGAIVLRVDSAKTDYRIGLAHSIDVELDEGPSTLEVQLPEKGLSATIVLELAQAYVAVSVVENQIRFRISDRPFRYA